MRDRWWANHVQLLYGCSHSNGIGASCLLLTVAVLEWPALVEMHREAHNCGLETLVEVYDEAELVRALTLDLDLPGINNREILVLEKDDGTVSTMLELVKFVPPGVTVYSSY